MADQADRDRPAIAALPMYDWPDVRGATDTIWRHLAIALRSRGLDAPDHLERGRTAEEIWRDPDLMIAQTCGYPFVTELLDRVRVVATPVYDVDGCRGPLYSSHLVVRAGEAAQAIADMKGRRAAINNLTSQSGYAALHAAIAALAQDAPFFGAVELSGSHLNSMIAVANGKADIAAIDAVCWALARRYRPDVTARLKSIATTLLTPALPLVTSRHRPESEVDLIADAVRECLADPRTEGAREQLFLKSVERLPETDYLAAYARLDENDLALLTPDARAGDHPEDRPRAAQNPFP